MIKAYSTLPKKASSSSLKVRESARPFSVEHDRVQQLVRVLLLLSRDDVVDLAVEVPRRFDLLGKGPTGRPASQN